MAANTFVTASTSATQPASTSATQPAPTPTSQPRPKINQCFHVPTGMQEQCISSWKDLTHITLPMKFHTKPLAAEDKLLLVETYKAMYPNKVITADMVPRTTRQYSNVTVGKELYSSLKYGRCAEQYGHIMASWAHHSNDGTIDFDGSVRPGKVKYYFTNSLKVADDFVPHLFAAVQWFCEYPDRPDFLPPLSVWLDNKYVQPGPAAFIPVQRIGQKFACARRMGNRLVVAPIPPQVFV